MLKWITLRNIKFKKKIFILMSLLILFIISDFLSFKIDEHSSLFITFIKKYNFNKSLHKTKDLYKMQKKPLESDEFMMLNWLWDNVAQNTPKTFELDPFYRMLNKNYNGYIYNYRDLDKYKYLMTDWTDEYIISALYCDKLNYSENEFKKLKNIRDYEGGYGDTHYLLGLLFLKSLNCYPYEILSKEKKDVIESIIKAQNKIVQPSIDLFAERIVFLYWANKKKQIKYSWIKRIVDIQNNDGSWTDIGMQKSDFHITGLSALVLKYYINNNVDNDVWFIL